MLYRANKKGELHLLNALFAKMHLYNIDALEILCQMVIVVPGASRDSAH